MKIDFMCSSQQQWAPLRQFGIWPTLISSKIISFHVRTDMYDELGFKQPEKGGLINIRSFFRASFAAPLYVVCVSSLCVYLSFIPISSVMTWIVLNIFFSFRTLSNVFLLFKSLFFSHCSHTRLKRPKRREHFVSSTPITSSAPLKLAPGSSK